MEQAAKILQTETEKFKGGIIMIMTREYKAAWDKCLNLARALCYVRNEERRAELKRQLEEARVKREEIRIREERNRKAV